MLSRAVRHAPVRTSRIASRYATTQAHHQAETDEYPAEEGFKSSLWTYGALVAVGTGLYYKFKKPVPEGQEEQTPAWMNKFLHYHMPNNPNEWKDRNNQHLKLSVEAAETKLLFQSAERPRVKRMKYPGSFDQASPNNIALGYDNPSPGDVLIKTNRDDAKREGDADKEESSDDNEDDE